MSPKHLDRYFTEFSGRHNVRELDTIDQMAFLTKGIVGKKLPYEGYRIEPPDDSERLCFP